MNKEQLYKELCEKELDEQSFFEELKNLIISDSKETLNGLELWGSVRDKYLFIVQEFNGQGRGYGYLDKKDLNRLKDYYKGLYLTGEDKEKAIWNNKYSKRMV